MSVKNLRLALFALSIQSCSAQKSTTLPDYADTRIKVNTGSSQSASLHAKSSALEIKNSKNELIKVSAQLRDLREQIEANRIKLAR